mmetsp:Transcript_20641/g.59950  ORF Transcript_20641/g.59950 Transcript_20641/m.59950 type:complete len:343 (-) Transcript_20641:189-1217(-)
MRSRTTVHLRTRGDARNYHRTMIAPPTSPARALGTTVGSTMTMTITITITITTKMTTTTTNVPRRPSPTTTKKPSCSAVRPRPTEGRGRRGEGPVDRAPSTGGRGGEESGPIERIIPRPDARDGSGGRRRGRRNGRPSSRRGRRRVGGRGNPSERGAKGGAVAIVGPRGSTPLLLPGEITPGGRSVSADRAVTMHVGVAVVRDVSSVTPPKAGRSKSSRPRSSGSKTGPCTDGSFAYWRAKRSPPRTLTCSCSSTRRTPSRRWKPPRYRNSRSFSLSNLDLDRTAQSAGQLPASVPRSSKERTSKISNASFASRRSRTFRTAPSSVGSPVSICIVATASISG